MTVRFSIPVLRRYLAPLLIFGLGACQSQPTSETSTSETPQAPAVDEEVITQVFPDDFEQVCNGIAFEPAKSYEPVAGSVHPIYVFDREDDGQSFSKSYRELPNGWELEFEESQNAQLVACLTVTAQELANTCEFPPEEGETIAYTLETYSATYNVEIYAAQSGELLDSKILELQGEDCPVVHFFTEGETVDTSIPDYSQALLEFVKPYVQPEA
ncbi:MAG: hypothetical protein ACFB0C_23600 [Leptolyngbyaceae cyanobacterium]